jgi:hypothetical protein
MRWLGWELIVSLIAVVLVTVWYVAASRAGGVPRPGGLAGHTLGIVGFLLMLATETLYSIRKRIRGFHFGPTGTWLRFHIVTGVIGSYLVLLHTAGKFHGLAGLTAVLTVLVLTSGFIGRYIYTAVPRNLEGVEVEARELEMRIAEDDRRLQALGINLIGTKALAITTELPRRGWMLVFGRMWFRWRQRRRLKRAIQDLHPKSAVEAAKLLDLLEERAQLLASIHSLAVTRRFLALWHVFHLPLGAVLFTLAFVHVGAALYYGTLLK